MLRATYIRKLDFTRPDWIAQLMLDIGIVVGPDLTFDCYMQQLKFLGLRLMIDTREGEARILVSDKSKWTSPEGWVLLEPSPRPCVGFVRVNMSDFCCEHNVPPPLDREKQAKYEQIGRAHV